MICFGGQKYNNSSQTGYFFQDGRFFEVIKTIFQ